MFRITMSGRVSSVVIQLREFRRSSNPMINLLTPGREVVTLWLSTPGGRRLRKDTGWNCPQRKSIEKRSSMSGSTSLQGLRPRQRSFNEEIILGPIRISFTRTIVVRSMGFRGPSISGIRIWESFASVLPRLGRWVVVLAVIESLRVIGTRKLTREAGVVVGRSIVTVPWLTARSALWNSLWPRVHVKRLFVARRFRKFGMQSGLPHSGTGTSVPGTMFEAR